MSVDILGTSWDQCRSVDQYSFTSTEARRLVRTDSPGLPPRLSRSSWTMIVCLLVIEHFIVQRNATFYLYCILYSCPLPNIQWYCMFTYRHVSLPQTWMPVYSVSCCRENGWCFCENVKMLDFFLLLMFILSCVFKTSDCKLSQVLV